MTGSTRSLSLIVPTLREAENIPVLAEREAAVARAHELDVEMLIVDDRSDDGTPDAVARLADRPWVRVIVRDGPRSLSWAVVDGMRQATYDRLVVMDADLSHPPEAIPALVSALDDPEIDFVVGSRYVPGGTIDPRWTLFRRINSLAARLMARPLVPVRDATSGFFALRRAQFRAAGPLKPVGYKIGLELLVKCHCRNVLEVPIHFSERHRGTTKFGLRQRLEYLEHLRRLWVYRFSVYFREPKVGPESANSREENRWQS